MRTRALGGLVLAVALLVAACGAPSDAPLAVGSDPSSASSDPADVVSTTTEVPEPELAERIPVSQAVVPPPPPTLSAGARGPEVYSLQARLSALGYGTLVVDGHFGEYTRLAVEDFQRGQGLGIDGIAGAATWLALVAPTPFTPGPLVIEEPEPEPEPEPDGADAPGSAPDPGAPLGYIPDDGIGYVVVRLASQRVQVFGHGDQLLFDFGASTGRSGLTPRGEFRITHRSASTVSVTDHQVSMRWMTNFNGYIGFHGIPVRHGSELWTPLGQEAVSAGCVRLSDDAAQLIFDHAPNGTRVIVTD
ncbi:MAG: murein L,D-transpeptidase [Acidimicrobiia bacterium]|nr:murein L,D-transpeptidase [Acidimicrobiia bacterium]